MTPPDDDLNPGAMRHDLRAYCESVLVESPLTPGAVMGGKAWLAAVDLDADDPLQALAFVSGVLSGLSVIGSSFGYESQALIQMVIRRYFDPFVALVAPAALLRLDELDASNL